MTLLQDQPAPPSWLPDSLDATWQFLAAYPLLLGLAVGLAGVTLALTARSFVLFWGLKVAKRTETELDEMLVRLGARVVTLLVAYVSLFAAIEVMTLPPRISTVLTRLVASLLVLQLMRAGFRAAHIGLLLLSHLRERFPIVEERTIPLFDLVATIFLVGIAAYALLQVWNIDATAWLASAGVVGIAVGFAAKDTLANLFAGFFIIADAPYKVGDYVVLDTGERGEITKVGVRSTRMLTRDDVEVIIPNSAMANQKIVNESGGPHEKYRVRVKVGVAYGSDLDHVCEVLMGVAAAYADVCVDPAPRVRIRGFGNYGIDVELLAWVENPVHRGRVLHDLYMEVYKAFAREKIEIPYPKHEVFVQSFPSEAR